MPCSSLCKANNCQPRCEKRGKWSNCSLFLVPTIWDIWNRIIIWVFFFFFFFRLDRSRHGNIVFPEYKVTWLLQYTEWAGFPSMDFFLTDSPGVYLMTVSEFIRPKFWLWVSLEDGVCIFTRMFTATDSRHFLHWSNLCNMQYCSRPDKPDLYLI